MLEAPDVFQGLILGSRAFYWDDQVMLKLEAKFAEQKTALPATVFFTVGALETPAMLDNLQRFRTTLTARNHQGLTVHYRLFDEATLVSVSQVPSRSGCGRCLRSRRHRNEPGARLSERWPSASLLRKSSRIAVAPTHQQRTLVVSSVPHD